MTGETNLNLLLQSLDPWLDEQEYGFATLSPGSPLPASLTPIATFIEDEGMTVVAPASQLQRAGLDHLAGWAWVTLRVHSSLQAIGMMAKISTELAAHKISVNPFAGYYHDHIFVQWDRRHLAIKVLNGQKTPGGE